MPEITDAPKMDSIVLSNQPALQAAECVTVDLAAKLIGLTDKAIRRKIDEGKWLNGRQYFKAPDGRIYIYMPGVYRWVKEGA